ncbi:MAG: hypothetical protein F6J93_30735 [Oscillatoria sp. SIO1A7]|nr:hypothetical protein [Oscillatoria sp. SIO1A7]
MTNESNKASTGNVTGGIIGGRDARGVAGQGAAGRDISGTVSVAIGQLPDSPEPDRPGIKELLTQLQEAIASEPALDEDDKETAIEQLNKLAEAGKNPSDGGMKKKAKQAMQMLTGIFAGLPALAKLVETSKQVLPVIGEFFGL